ncbi:MAG TPA: DUF4097 family beta strand repeat-containing protein [Candidatus Acidoferrales bacterium]|nr:DUF4097 family beta strand repeat-containing protein [Candidatus Acidoferrales bacterium]
MNNTTRSSFVLIAAVVAAGFAFTAPRVNAQSAPPAGTDRIAVKLDDPSRPALVKASLINGGITVKGYEGTEVIVEARTRSQQEEERSPAPGGMKRLSILRTGLSVEEDNNEVRIGTDSHMRAIDLTISVPLHTSLTLRAINDGDIVVTDVDGELDVNNTNGTVTLKNVSGGCVAHALNGRVLVTFVKVNSQKPMAFSSLNGDIDVTFPADLKASLTIRSDRGDVFSDFDVQLQAAAPQQTVEDGKGKGGKYRVKIDKTVHGTINGGGQEIQLTNFQGAIYIRKAGSGR